MSQHLTNIRTAPGRVAHLTSPHTQRSARVEHFRESAVEHLIGHDTRIIELLLSILMFTNALQVMEPEGRGAWLSPFISMVYGTLHIPRWAWLIAFVALSMWKAAAVLKGWRNKNCFKQRARASFVGSMAWAVIMLAIVTSGQPAQIVIRYLAYALVSMACHIILRVQEKKLPGLGCG